MTRLAQFTAASTAAMLIGAPAMAQDGTFDTLAEGPERPWAMTFLPNGNDTLMTGRNGAFSIYDAASGAVRQLDGQAPADNPFVDVDGARPAIWSYGHRNIQAMAVQPETGDVWLAEHGEAGGDEINIVQRGENYGWPLVAYGVDYRTGAQFAPACHWGPGRDAHFPPSGMVFYDADAFPDWEGHLLVGNLYHQYLGLFAVDVDNVSDPARLLDGEGIRIRDVAVGPNDGLIYVPGDGDSALLLRNTPAAA